MTINKLNLPAKENAVQSKINEIIDNFPETDVFVAEYDVTSYSDILSEYNAGKLIFLKSDYLIFGTGEQGTYSIPLEKYDEKTDSTAEFVFSAINNSTQKKYIISSSNTWSMDTSVFANATLSNVSSISNNSAVKTALDGKADTTLSNVSSIDSNSAVQTALDGKANTSLSNLTSTSCTNFDGQWVVKNVVLSTSSTVGTYNLTNTLKAQLPNDNYDYEILLSINGRATTSCQCSLKTAYTSEEWVLWMTANSRSAGTFMILPVNSSRTLTQKVITADFGAIEIKLQAYRRIGTNS